MNEESYERREGRQYRTEQRLSTPFKGRSAREGANQFEVEFYNKLVIMNGDSPGTAGAARVRNRPYLQEEEQRPDLRLDRQPHETMIALSVDDKNRSTEKGGSNSLHLDPGNEEELQSVISKQGTRNLLQHLDPFVAVDGQVQNMIGIMMDDFVQRITEFACTLAKHRKDSLVQKQDILFAAERLFGISDDPSLENINDLINPSKLQKDFSEEPRY